MITAERNEICTDFFQIISGSSNTLSTSYTEAANTVTRNTENALGYLKNFIASIEEVASHRNAIDKRISASKGNIKNFSSYDNIEKSLKFITTNKTPSGNAIKNDLVALHECLEKYQSYYVSAYNRNNRLIVLEYECAMYLLVTGLAMSLSFCFEVTENAGTTKIMPKAKAYFGTTGKKIHEMAEQLKKADHAKYLDELDKASSNKHINESVYTESIVSIVASTVEMLGSIFGAGKSVAKLGMHAFQVIKRTVFGIVPLIRGVIYLSYKRKADTILSLEQNVMFIERNIEILTNRKDLDPAKKEIIIKKQRAKIEEFNKKAEKLRAQLEEGEKEAAAAIKSEDTKMTTPANGDDDDFVLENADSLYSIIMERRTASLSPDRMINRRRSEMLNNPRGRKKSAAAYYSNKNINPDDSKKLDNVIAEFKKKSARKTVRLSITKGQDSPSKITSSKLGGQPYWPKGKAYPQFNGKDGVLVAQINFGELPHIDGFPSNGIVQFFMKDGEFNNNDIKTVYHPTLSKDIDTTVRPTTADAVNINDPIIDGVYYISGRTITEMYPCQLYELEFDYYFMPIFNKHFGTDLEYLAKIDDHLKCNVTGILWDRLFGKNSGLEDPYGTRMGGYPAFCQYDPRTFIRGRGKYDKDIQLLQIDTEAGIVWGDNGIAHFFISSEDLRAKKFDNCMFSWDCY